ncbi:hypothetical protein Tco_0902489, partial [Tanacetum coccineum]
ERYDLFDEMSRRCVDKFGFGCEMEKLRFRVVLDRSRGSILINGSGMSSKLKAPSLVTTFRRNARSGIEQTQFDSMAEIMKTISLVPRVDRYIWSWRNEGHFRLLRSQDVRRQPGSRGELSNGGSNTCIKVIVWLGKFKSNAHPMFLYLSSVAAMDLILLIVPFVKWVSKRQVMCSFNAMWLDRECRATLQKWTAFCDGNYWLAFMAVMGLSNLQKYIRKKVFDLLKANERLRSRNLALHFINHKDIERMIELIADHTGHVTVGSVMTSATINSGYGGLKLSGVPVEPSDPAKNVNRTGKLTLLLSANREPDNTTLPEDCHYQLEDLVKLLYLPNVMCLGKRGMRHSGEGNNETFASWDDNFGQFDDGNAYDRLSGSNELKYAQSYSVSHVLILTVFVDLFQRSLLNRRLARTIGASSSSSSPSFAVLRRGSERTSTTMVIKFSPVTWNAVHFGTGSRFARQSLILGYCLIPFTEFHVS